MNSILDYIVWRGDLPFSVSPLNEIDALIFSQLSYINYDDIVPASFKEKVLLKEAAEKIAALPDDDFRKHLDGSINPDTLMLLTSAGSSIRFGSVEVCGYCKKTSSEREEQFACLTFQFDKKNLFVAFRGTDGSLIGWKENFNMAFLSPLPAQMDSVTYIEEASRSLRGSITTGGHSKGGNLAVYSAAFCSEKTQARILNIYNFDGPGFEDSVINKKEFQRILPLIRTFMPKSSIVGILFEHKEYCVFVENDEIGGALQHDPFTWPVYGTVFVSVDMQTIDSIFVDITVKHWLESLSKDQLEVFVDTLFEVLGASNIKSISELAESWLKKPHAVIKTLANIDSGTKEAVLQVVHLLFHAARENVPVVAELLPLHIK